MGMSNQPTFIINDGGRAEAGYKGQVNDCVVRAVAIATEMPYKQVYQRMNIYLDFYAYGRTARQGIPLPIIQKFMKALGWKYVEAKQYGKHSSMHLNAKELPSGRIIADMKGHVSAVIDGVIHDTWDASNGGETPVNGYWVAA